MKDLFKCLSFTYNFLESIRQQTNNNEFRDNCLDGKSTNINRPFSSRWSCEMKDFLTWLMLQM